jgi:hypothetical protein
VINQIEKGLNPTELRVRPKRAPTVRRPTIRATGLPLFDLKRLVLKQK